MAGFAKWIAGGLGFVMGGPIGATLGFVLGSVLDTFSSGDNNESDNHQSVRQKQEGDFRMSLLVLISCVMKADGVIQKKELDVVKRFLVRNFDEEGALQALQILKGLLQQNINEVEVARQINRYMNYSSKLELVHFLLDISYADEIVSPSEYAVVQRIAIEMGVRDLDFQSLYAAYNKTQNSNWAYDLLEISPDSSDEDIKKAYRSMAMKYHPDKVHNLGDEVKLKATEKFRSVNEAYEYLKKTRNIN